MDERFAGRLMSPSDPVTLAFDGDIALLRIDNPPVNAISPDVVQGAGARDRAL
jgi:enoyl-CoA hydratase/carnithine racemase